ncbi:MAG TPA: mannitol dehydrogenase family protein [Actinoplanes sp.]|nr:mannitol dehydrogenase family protein [Actinoplanes sp.]
MLSRAAGHGRTAPPVRLLHLGLGNFFRAHQCWYTDHAPDAGEWGYAAFSGLGRGDLTQRLDAQDGLYTLVTRAPAGDAFEVISSLSRAHGAQEHQAWLDYFRSADLRVVTLTVTEAGYLRGPDGGLDAGRTDVQADLAALRDDPSALVRTTPARLVAGLAARRAADAGPLALVPCDNVPGNGAIAGRVVLDMARLFDPGLLDWLDTSLAVVATAVDRITPRPAPDEAHHVRNATGHDDSCPVATEPFCEWVLSGSFPAGRPAWQDTGATFTDDVTPYEHRKLWLLNGGHSLLAYAGSIRGHTSVAEAVADDTCRDWLRQWWDTASRHLKQPEADLAAYQDALLDRFANPRMRHHLAQIGADGSQKLPIRILPTLRAERAQGRMPTAATLVLAAWICCLRGLGAPVSDVRAQVVVPLAGGRLRDAVPVVLRELDPSLGDDADLVVTVVRQCEQLASPTRS